MNIRRTIVSWIGRWLNDEDILRLSLEQFDPYVDMVKEEEEEVIADLSDVENIVPYFNSMLYKDKNRYFAAPNLAKQKLIKGGYSRAMYLKSRIKDYRKKQSQDNDEGGDSSFSLPRYME